MNKTLTVNVAGYDVRVTGDFQPEERMTREYPGCPASFDYESFSYTDDTGKTVQHDTDGDIDLQLHDQIIAGIEEAVLEAISDAEYAARCEANERDYDDHLAERAFTDAELSRWEPDTGPHF